MALEDAKKQVDLAFTAAQRRGLAFENAFGGAVSFLRRRYSKDLAGVDVAVTGIPFDQAVTHRPGTRFGPRAIREASTLQPFDPPYGWPVSPIEVMDVVDYGDLAFDYARTSDFPDALTAHIRGILASGAASVALGGDHYVSFPILRAYAEKYGPVSLLHFDAHCDTWADDDMERIDHGTMFYKAVKSGIVDPKTSVQIGIRTHNDDFLGVNVIDAREVHETGAAAVAAKARAILGDRPVYLTFDIDCLDPSAAPGTGTPIPGGLTYHQAASVIRRLKDVNFVGMDMVEVSPPYDHSELTSAAAASLIMEYICLRAWQRGARAEAMPE